MIPGEYHLGGEPIEINSGRPTVELRVLNTGDRPVQVGSHYHFAEANSALDFDRAAARGYRLDIPAGTATRFEPGDARTVQLVALGGARRVFGISGLVDGPLDADADMHTTVDTDPAASTRIEPTAQTGEQG